MLVAGIVYFYPGKKYPMLVYNCFEFKKHNSTHSDKNFWRCTRENTKLCRARLMTFGKCLKLMNNTHTHPETYKGRLQDLKSVIVDIAHWFKSLNSNNDHCFYFIWRNLLFFIKASLWGVPNQGFKNAIIYIWPFFILLYYSEYLLELLLIMLFLYWRYLIFLVGMIRGISAIINTLFTNVYIFFLELREISHKPISWMRKMI